MDRKTLYRGELPYETDLLLTSRYLYEGLGLFFRDIIGVSTVVSGLACGPSSPAALTVQMGPGRLYSLQNLEPTAWGVYLATGGLAADTNADHQIVKQGLYRDTTTLSGFTAPGTAGQSINYLIQAAFSEADSTPVQRQFYNTTAPANPTLQNVSDARQDLVVLTVKAGTAATTGSQVTPTADSGNVPLWVVTVANGQSTITSANIAQHPSAPYLGSLNGVLTGVVTPAQITANQNNYAPTGLSTALVGRLSTDASRNITGIAGGLAGRLLWIQNVGSFPIVLVNASASSTAANRFAFNYDRTIDPGRTLPLIYDATQQRWVDAVALSKALGSDLLAGTNDERFLTPKSIFDAAAPVSVAFAASQTLDFGTGFNFDLGAATAAFTLQNPSNAKVGQSGRIRIPQDATGGRLITYGTWFKAPGGAQALSTAASAVDCLYYYVRSATEIEYTLARGFA